ncbi:MAG: MmcQ/YjbR family DNA-binding protein [Pseudomonadota bacterium]
MNAFRTRVAEICGTLPGAEVSDPWGGGHEVWKVGEKMFAGIGAVTMGVSVKTPDVETAALLIDAGVGSKAPYMHKSWILLPEETDAGELRHRILASYDLIRAKLPAKVRKALPEREGQS